MKETPVRPKSSLVLLGVQGFHGLAHRPRRDMDQCSFEGQRPRGSDNHIRRSHWTHGHARVALNWQLNDRCPLAWPQLGQQNSSTVGKFDCIVMDVGIIRVQLAEAHEVARRLSNDVPCVEYRHPMLGSWLWGWSRWLVSKAKIALTAILTF